MKPDNKYIENVPDITDAAATAPLMPGNHIESPAEAPPELEPFRHPIAAEAMPVQEADDLPDDPLTESLVEDIIIHDSDELLASRDGASSPVSTRAPASQRQPSHHRLASFFGGWWHNKLARYGTLLLLLAAAGALGAMPTSRYAALNTVGVRSAASLTILDNTTQLPLKNVAIELGDRKAKTNQDGVVQLHDLKLGTQALSVSQSGFATVSKTVTLGLGSNPLGEFTLDAVGMQFRFKLTDYLSGKSIKNAEINSGDANAKSDVKGLLVLTVGANQTDPNQATISADGYRDEYVSLDSSAGQPIKQSRDVSMVPRQKEMYISKQSGKYDLYKADIDGKNKQPLLAATGLEDGNISVVQSPSGDEVALVSKRDTTHNQDGFPLQTLTLIEVNSGVVLTLDHSERIQLVDWIGNKLVYVKIKAGTSAGNPERYQLMSYDYDTTSRLQLATANIFNDVVSAQGAVYFAASNNFQGGTSQLVRINPDSTGKQILLDKMDVWNIARTAYDTLDLSVLDGQYQYKIGDADVKKVSDTPASGAETKFYLDAADGKHALYTDSRDGKGVLLAYNADTDKETLLATQSGLSYPVRWLNDRTIIYRIVTASETADYAVSLDGGTPKKVNDLTNTAGFGKWNYR